MRVVAATRTPRPDHATELGIDRLVGMDGLGGILSEADVLVVAVPLDRDTTGLLGARELSLLRPSAYLVTVARGPVIDEDALFEALSGRRGDRRLVSISGRQDPRRTVRSSIP